MSLQTISAPKKKAPQRIRMSQTEISEKFFGPKPNYTKLDFEDPKARQTSLIYSLKWYSNFFENKKSGAYVTTWLKKQKYFSISAEEIRRAISNFGLFAPTYYALMRMEETGWKLSEKEITQIQDHLIGIGNAKFVPDEITEDSSAQTQPAQPAANKTPVKTLLIEKLNSTVLSELEGMYDVWLFAKNPTERKETYDLNEAILRNEIKGSVAMNLIRDWINPKLDELLAVKNKTDSELVEGYSTLKRINLTNTITKLQELLSSIDVVKTNTRNLAAANRKPRAKKEVAAHKQIATLKYKPQDTELGITSVAPESIIGSKTVFLFNTRYNTLMVLNSSEDEGFTVKGTTIIGINESLSFNQKLRKPHETIQFILSTSSRIKIDNHLKTLTTKPSGSNGRVNENVVILKTLK